MKKLSKKNADFELNTDTFSQAVGDSTYDQGGRVAVNASSTHTSGDNFVTAKGTVLLTTDGTTGVDDAYIQMGNSTVSVQAGRFEGVNLFPLGKDTMVSHAGDVTVYNAGDVRGRAGSKGGQFALHVNASDSVKFEVDTIFGDADSKAGAHTSAVSGIRPSVSFTTDMATFTVGYESVKYDLTGGGDVNKSGFGATVNFNVGDANINLAATSGKDDNTDQKVSSLAANMTYGNFGLGVISSSEDNTTGSDPSVMTTYVAYTMPLLDIDNASVTLAGSYSTADDVAVGTNDKTTAARVRFNYSF
ncbi:carbohydrate porin [Marinomonas sp. IMCC 4694]|uniref:carbohydrate porin n=1 Tax=Marinomonas sp. IMCC 4694 TaxID=2605432 RepID=UPI0011E75480|nr:carbohydrate porin [Marinomonas sp. IMCC 4694]TYL46580.1 hypothetical protein FXV75_00675 [Marinomonas sp. IMCC 4694]